MNINWILILLGFDAAVLSAMLLVVGMLRRDRKQSQTEVAALRGQLDTLASEVEHHKAQVRDLELQLGEAQRATPAVPKPQFVPAPAISADKRAEALEMLRSGADTGTVSVRLHLSHAETALLGKVQVMLRPESGR